MPAKRRSETRISPAELAPTPYIHWRFGAKENSRQAIAKVAPSTDWRLLFAAAFTLLGLMDYHRTLARRLSAKLAPSPRQECLGANSSRENEQNSVQRETAGSPGGLELPPASHAARAPQARGNPSGSSQERERGYRDSRRSERRRRKNSVSGIKGPVDWRSCPLRALTASVERRWYEQADEARAGQPA